MKENFLVKSLVKDLMQFLFCVEYDVWMHFQKGLNLFILLK